MHVPLFTTIGDFNGIVIRIMHKCAFLYNLELSVWRYISNMRIHVVHHYKSDTEKEKTGAYRYG